MIQRLLNWLAFHLLGIYSPSQFVSDYNYRQKVLKKHGKKWANYEPNK